MIDIKELIAERQRRDPSFRVTRHPRTGQYYVQNQVIFQYSVSKSPEEAVRLARGYVDRVNQQRQEAGQPVLNLNVTALSKLIVVISGRGAVELTVVGGGTTPHPPPPPPPWRPDTILPDRILVIQVLVGVNNVRYEVIPQSYAIAAGIRVETVSVA